MMGRPLIPPNGFFLASIHAVSQAVHCSEFILGRGITLVRCFRHPFVSEFVILRNSVSSAIRLPEFQLSDRITRLRFLLEFQNVLRSRSNMRRLCRGDVLRNIGVPGKR